MSNAPSRRENASSHRKRHTFPVKPKLRGISSVDCNISFMCCGAGVQVVARVPSAGPVPPPTNVVTPTLVLIHNRKETKREQCSLIFSQV